MVELNEMSEYCGKKDRSLGEKSSANWMLVGEIVVKVEEKKKDCLGMAGQRKRMRSPILEGDLRFCLESVKSDELQRLRWSDV